MDKQNDLIPVATNLEKPMPAIVATAPETQLDKFIDMTKDLDPEKLDKFVALYNQQQDRQRKEDFEAHFAALQADLGPIVKSKDAMNQGKKMYSYAPLDTLQAACGEAISRHGFSYSWREETKEGGIKRTILMISGWGYTRENYFDAPMISGTGIQNAIQVAGAMSTYGRRYTFIAGFGLIIEGEDSDANISDDPDTLKMDLLEFCEKKINGQTILLPGSIKMIRAECDKPAELRDVERMKAWHKRARAKCEGGK